MDTEAHGNPAEQNANKRRKIMVDVDAQNAEIPDPKRPTVAINRDLKKRVHKAIAVSYSCGFPIL